MVAVMAAAVLLAGVCDSLGKPSPAAVASASSSVASAAGLAAAAGAAMRSGSGWSRT